MNSRKDGFNSVLIQSDLHGTECGNTKDMPFKTSKLSASFSDMLKDTSTLSMLDYFIQYLETVHTVNLIQFWLSVESFKATVSSKEQLAKDRSRERRKTRVLSRASSVSSSGSDTPSRLSHEHVLGELNSSGLEKSQTGYFHYEKDLRRVNDLVSGSGASMNNEVRSSPVSKWRDDKVKDGGERGNFGSPDDKDLTSTGSDSQSKRNGVGEGSKKLHRRETENYMYCNCKVHVWATPPGTPESPRANGRPVSWQESPCITLKCEHGSHETPSRTTLDGYPVSSQAAPDQTSIQSMETDAVSIYSKYLALNAPQPVGISDDIRQKVEVSICPEDGNISSSCFDESQQYVYEVMRKKYFPGFLHSSFLCKYQLEYIATGNLNLTDFLLGETALTYFMEFMEQEHMAHLLQFWLIADNFHNEFSSPNHVSSLEVDINDAMTIYDRYLSLQATQSLNMEDSVRLDVENRICDEHGPRADSFLRPQLVAFHTMNELYYPVFRESSIYLRFLNELLHTLNKEDKLAQSASSSGDPGENDPADSTSDPTTQAQVPSFAAHLLGRDLDDPGSLWVRPSLLFRLGYVNEMGEYISEIDNPDTKSKKEGGHSWSASARTLKKRRKEKELAMKIARNIIREVMDTGDSKTAEDS